MYRIAIYGKGGIGKSTTASNLSAALAESGLRVLQIGCDPKADSTSLLTGTDDAPTVLDLIRAGEDTLTLDKLVRTGYRGVMCVEAGGPTPGIGCAGRGIITAFEKLAELDAYSVLRPDAVVYDVLGDVVCGGFAMPLRREYADVVYIVTSGEKMSLYAASNIVSAVMNFKTRGYARYGGLILNRRGVENEAERVFDLAERTDGTVIADLPRSETVQQAEALGKTVMEALPDSQMSGLYRELARRIIEECENGSAR